MPTSPRSGAHETRSDGDSARLRTQQLDLPLLGRFDLSQSIGFGFGQRSIGDDDVMRMAFCLDGLQQQVAVGVRQVAADTLQLEVVGDDDIDLDLDAVRRQVARVLSVDVDARPYDDLGGRDAYVGRVQAARPGLRPPLFYSAYEALLWSLLSARQPFAQMLALRERLSRELGRVFTVAGQEVVAAPLPAQLAELGDLAGLRVGKADRLRALAGVAATGQLDTETLRGQEIAEAGQLLQGLAGIGPFYAELVVIRALGHTDVLTTHEPMVRDLAGQLTDAGRSLSDQEFADLAESWRPWRTWVLVATRASADQLGLTSRRGQRR
jgi:DNA-3-methyladenine glycosylase II